MSSFFVADQKIPIKQESIGIPSTNGLSYNPGQVIELQIDPQVIKFFSPKDTYLQFNVKIQQPADTNGSLTRLMLDSHIGAQILIKEIRIHDGNNNALLEEIVGYNIACMTKYDYHSNESLRNKRALAEGAGARDPRNLGYLGSGDSYQSANNNAYTKPPKDNTVNNASLLNAEYIDAKVCLPLNTGIFSNDKVFPTMLTSGLRISIILEDANKCIKQMESVMLNRKTYLNPFVHSQNGTTGVFTQDDDFTTIFLTPDNSQVAVDRCPFVIGESLGFWDMLTNQQRVLNGDDPIITAIELDGTTELIKLTTTSFQPTNDIPINTNGSSTLYSLSVDSGTTYNPTYRVSNVELIVQSLDMGAGYESDMMKRMREGGTINYDFLSMTNYRYSQLASDRVANIQLPIENRRMKSIICVPTDSSVYTGKMILNAGGVKFGDNDYTYKEDNSADYNYREYQDRVGIAGIADEITSYQFLYAGRLQPSRLVDCSKTSSRVSVSQQHLIELEKALTQANISGQSMLEFNTNFCIGRAVAVQNGIYDGRNRQFSLQVNYQEGDAPAKNKLWNNFVYHIRRLVIKGDNISVEV